MDFLPLIHFCCTASSNRVSHFIFLDLPLMQNPMAPAPAVLLTWSKLLVLAYSLVLSLIVLAQFLAHIGACPSFCAQYNTILKKCSWLSQVKVCVRCKLPWPHYWWALLCCWKGCSCRQACPSATLALHLCNLEHVAALSQPFRYKVFLMSL